VKEIDMMWQLSSILPVERGLCVPADTVLTSVSGEPPTWNGLTLSWPMPINAIALDNEAAQMMLEWYGGNYDLTHQLLWGPDVDLDTVKRRRGRT
jgi:hypothetical protein